MNLLFFWMITCLHPFWNMDPDPKPLSSGSGSDKSYGTLRIQIHNTDLVL
jgi:hypothetical protein